MKRLLIVFISLILVFSVCSCGGAGDPENGTGADNGVKKGIEVEINGEKFKLNYETHHKDMFFKEDLVEFDKNSYGQVCNIEHMNDGETVFAVRIVYFDGKTADEVLSDSDVEVTDKTVHGLEYKYFEYDENGVPGHTYVYCFDGTTYTISFVSKYDTTSLEDGFFSCVRFEKSDA